jgi:hypothetical protein
MGAVLTTFTSQVLLANFDLEDKGKDTPPDDDSLCRG